jgi:filamentous hemagglutinin family protein
MNRIFRTLWSIATQSWQAVPETAKTAGKKSTSSASGVVASVALSFALTGGAGAQSPPAVNQLPTGGTVVRGAATISQTATAQAAAMTVNQTSQRAVVNWNTFNLGSAASINFVQPNAEAVILNRVTDSNPSQIFGRITSNGQVFISNANGVYFSPTSSVDVGSITATTHSISNDNFMSGNYVFDRNGATGKVVNEGRITAALGGYVALLAPEVQNAGVVVARAGSVAMAAGEMITLNMGGAGSLAGITTTPSAIASLIENKQAVHAPDGQIILSAMAVNKLQAGVIKNSGSLEASSLVSKGGKIYLETDEITLASNSKIEAKGALGGGTVLVGGDWQGSGEMRQATKVTMEAGASIDASATDLGNGGKVVLWSDIHNAGSVTRVNGSIKAEAGPNGGDGGQVETSGHGLEVGDAVISAQSFKGKDGLWLLDPYNITISSSANASTSKVGSTFSASVSGGVVNATTLQTALSTNNVTVSTTGAGIDAGNITVSSDLSWSSNKVLTLTANGGISGTGNMAMSGASGTGVVFNQGGNSTFNGNISGTNATVSKQGLGILTLGGNNTYGGITTVSAGTLKIGSATALGAATNNDADRTDIATGASLDLNSFSLNERLVLSGTLTNSSAEAVTAYTGMTLLTGTVGTAVVIQADAGAINLAAMLGVPPNGVVLGGSTGGSFSGIIGASGANQPAVTKNGSGTWTFNGAQNYLRDDLRIQAGTLKLGPLNTNFFGSFVNAVNISSGAVLEMASDNTVSTTTPIIGMGSVLKSGSGTFSLRSTSNAYSGGTTIAAGILRAGNGAGVNSVQTWLGTGTVTVQSGASFDIAGNKISNPITINGTGVNNSGALQNNSTNAVNVDLSGLITLGSDSSIMNNASTGSTLTLSNTGTITGSGYSLTLGGNGTGTSYLRSIIGIGSGNVIKTGTGVWSLTGSNTFDGNVYVNGGLLSAGALTALGSTVGRTIVASGASLNFSISPNNNFSIDEPLTLSGYGYSSTVGALDNTYATRLNYTGTITLEGTTRISVASSRTLAITNTIANGDNNVFKSGSGTLLLQGSPNFSGSGGLKTSTAFVKADASSSIYGSAPTISYQLYSDAAAATVTSISSVSGTPTFFGAPTNTSNAGTYSLQYDKGLTSPTYAVFPATTFTTWTVNPKPITLSNNNVSTTYDGTSSYATLVANAGYTTNTPLVGSDAISSLTQIITNTNGVALSGIAQAGTFNSAPSAAQFSTGLASNYVFLYTAATSNYVNKYNLIVAPTAGQSKTYGDQEPTTLTYTTAPLIGNDSSITGLAGTLDRTSGETAGTYAYSTALLSANNYTFSLVPNSSQFSITPRPITLTATTQSKTYGNADPTLAASITAGSLGSATVSDTLADVTGTLTRTAGENVGSYDVALGSGAKVSNYNITFATNNQALTIDPRAVVLTGQMNFSGQSMLDTASTGSTLAATNLVGNDSLTFGGTVALAAANAGAQTITGFSSLTLSNPNYTSTGASGSVTVLPTSAINVTTLNNTDVAALIGSQLAGITGSQIGSLSNSQLQVFSAQQIASLSSSQLSGFNGAQIGSLSTAQLQGIRPAQVALLAPAQLAGLDAAQVASFSTPQLQALTAAQVNAIAPAQLSALSAAQISLLTGNTAAPLSFAQVFALSPNQVSAIQPAQLSRMTAAEVGSFTDAQLQALTPEQIAAISPTSFGALGAEQIMAMSSAQVQSLSPEQLASFTPLQVASLSAAELGNFDATQLAAIGIFPKQEPSDKFEAAIPVMTAVAPDVTRMSGLEIRALTPEQLNAIPSQRVADLKPAQLQALTTTQLSQLTPEQVDNLSPSQLAVMSPRQLQALPTAPVTTTDTTPRTGVLAVTILQDTTSKPVSAGIAFEQDADTVSLKVTAAPVALPISEKVVFNDKLTTFLVATTSGEMVEFQGSLVNNRMVILAPSAMAKRVASTEMSLVLAAAVTSLGKENRVILAKLDGVVLDLR